MIKVYLIQPLACPYKKGNFGAQRQAEGRQCEDTREEHRLKMETEVGMMQLEAKGHQGLLAILEAGRGKKEFCSASQKRQGPADSGFRVLAGRTKRQYVSIISHHLCVVLCHSSPGKLIQ